MVAEQQLCIPTFAKTAALVRELGVSTQQAVQMIETLEGFGYLDEVVTGCGQPCKRCPVREACLFRQHPRLWTLTRKGEKLLATKIEALEECTS